MDKVRLKFDAGWFAGVLKQNLPTLADYPDEVVYPIIHAVSRVFLNVLHQEADSCLVPPPTGTVEKQHLVAKCTLLPNLGKINMTHHEPSKLIQAGCLIVINGKIVRITCNDINIGDDGDYIWLTSDIIIEGERSDVNELGNALIETIIQLDSQVLAEMGVWSLDKADQDWRRHLGRPYTTIYS